MCLYIYLSSNLLPLMHSTFSIWHLIRLLNYELLFHMQSKWINWVDFKILKLFLAFIVELEIGLISPQLNFLCSSCYSFNALSSPPSKFADGNLPNTHDHAQSSSLCAIVSLCIWYISIMSIPGNFNRQIILE
jgi:hypothetical protein